MNDNRKTKAQLIGELKQLRNRVAELERAVCGPDTVRPAVTISEKGIQDSEERYRNVVETALEGIWIVDPEAKTTYVNRHLADMLGYKADEMLRRPVLDFVHEEDREEAQQHLERGRLGSKEQRDFRFRRKDGSDLCTMLSTSPLFDAGGAFAGGLAMVVDVTDRRRAENALRESEHRWRTYIEEANDLIFTLDQAGRIMSVNKAACVATGFATEDLLGKSPIEFVAPEQRERAATALKGVLAGQPPGKIEIEVLSKSGGRIYLEVRGRVLYDGDRVTGAFEIARDITDRKAAEAALKESEALLHATIENLPLDLWARDREGRCIIQNPYSVLQWGNQIGKLPGETELNPEVLSLWETACDRALADEVVKQEFEIREGEQSGCYYGVVAPILVDGDVRGTLCVNIDITDRKRAEELLRQSEAKFRALAETTAAAIFIYQGSKFLYVNAATQEYTGCSREELLNGSFWDVVHPEHRELVRERGLSRQRGGPVPDRYEFKLLTKSGEARWVDATGSRLEYEGQPAAIGTAFDITDRKLAEDAQRQTQKQLLHVLLYSPAILYSLKIKGEELEPDWVSESLTKLTGYDLNEAFARDWWISHIHPDDRKRVLESLPRLFADDRLVQEYRFEHRDHGYLWVHDELRLLRDESGAPVEAIGSWIDVTERREAEAALRNSEERFRTLVSSMDDIVFTIDRQRRYSGVFAGWIEKFGLDRDNINIIGKTATDIFGEKAGRVHEESSQRALAGEQVIYEWSIVAGGETRVFQTALSPIKNQLGEVAGLVGVGRDVTERKRSEEQIHFQASLLDQVRNAVIAIDLDYNIIAWNRFAETLYQWTREEALGQNIVDLIISDPNRAAGEEIIELLRQTGHWEGEFIVSRKDGSTFPSYVHDVAIKDTNGKIVGFIGVSTDITERKRLDRALWESEDRFRSFMSHMPGYAWIKTLDGSYVYLNDKLRGTLSNYQDDWRGRTDLELFPYEIGVEFQKNDRMVIETRSALQTIEPWTWKDQARYALVTKFPIFDAQGELIMVAGASIDVTERKQAEDELRKQKEILESIFDHIPVMIRFRDEEGRLQLVNREWERTIGWTMADLQEREIDIMAEAYPDPEYRRAVLDFFAESSGDWTDFKTRAKSGDLIDTTWSSIRLSDGTALGFGRDITEQKRANALLQRRTAELAALHEIELEISAESELSRVLNIITRRAAELLNADHCSTYIREPENNQLNLVASLDSDMIGLMLEMGEGLAGTVAVTGRAELIDNYATWNRRAAALDGKLFGPSLGVPLKWQQTVIGAISLSRVNNAEKFNEEDSRLLQQLAGQAAIAIHQATLFEELREAKKRLQVLSHRLIDAQEAERQRIARELHDQVGQALTAVQISLQAVQSSPNGNSGLVENSLAIIDEALQQVHDLSLDLRPSLLDDLGLVAALRWYVDRVATRANLLRCFASGGVEPRRAPEIETACFRIAQEALTNVVRHARAKTVWVEVGSDSKGLSLLVRDDGIGFDVRAALARTAPNASLGLQGMQERAVAVGGIVAVTSQEGWGAEVKARFPLK